MKFEDVKKIGVVGGGVMGGGIAQIMTVFGGYEVVVRDISDEAIQTTHDAMFESKWSIKRAVERGKLEFDKAAEAIDRVTLTTDLADLNDCQFIIEAVPEKLELKQQVFKELDEAINSDAIFTSNTSGFVIAEIARDVSDQRKTLFAGMHYSNPVPVMKMCEVIYTPQTSEDTIDAVKRVGDAAGRETMLVRDEPGTYGFLLNRIFGAAKREADSIVDAGIATPEDIDRAMITGRNWPAGFYGQRGGIGKQW
jgi:3-hydroxybutyryl-CoA dehydrogenase